MATSKLTEKYCRRCTRTLPRENYDTKKCGVLKDFCKFCTTSRHHQLSKKLIREIDAMWAAFVKEGGGPYRRGKKI